MAKRQEENRGLLSVLAETLFGIGKPRERDFGLVVVGNALVDILSQTDDVFITQQGMDKGAMNLVDELGEAHKIYGEMGQGTEMSGGSGANSLSVFSSFGGQGAFIGKTASDELGEIFRHDLKTQGITYTTPVLEGAEQTGRSYIFVTPDGERTMNTYLGASTELDHEDIDGDLISRGKILLLEGYLFDKPSAKKAFMKAAVSAETYGTKVAFTLSDHRCVDRHIDDFRNLVANYVDILIGNEKEIKALTRTQTFEEAVEALSDACDTLVLTRGKDGAVIIDEGEKYIIPAVKPEKLVDTTGAGDAFAGGVLYGLSEGMSPDQAGLLGAKAASKTIEHIGARNPDLKFSDLLPS